MRKYVLLGLVIVVLLAMTSVALAGGYSTWGGSPPDSPHKNYGDSTDKCKVCHAVHNANQGGSPAPEALLKTSKSNACVYCHITGTTSLLEPYGSTEANYTTDYDWNHDDEHNSRDIPSYDGCTSCHAVHGANSFGKILRKNPGRGLATDAGTIEEFCRDCHNKSAANQTSGGCMEDPSCHQAANTAPDNLSPEYWTTARNGVTHVMTATMTNSAGTEIGAWNSNTTTCDDCHAAGKPGTNGDDFPHYTSPAVQFLDDAYSLQDSGMDRVCLNCHTDSGNPGAYTSGVGKTF